MTLKKSMFLAEGGGIPNVECHSNVCTILSPVNMPYSLLLPHGLYNIELCSASGGDMIGHNTFGKGDVGGYSSGIIVHQK